MRRLVFEDPYARSALWSRNLAVFALVVVVVGVLMSRKGLDPKTAVAIVGAALGLAGLAVLSAGVAMIVIWRTGFRGVGVALVGVVLAGLLFAYPAYIAVQARTGAALSDVTTSLDDPPQFLATPAAVAARHGFTPPLKPSQADQDLQQRTHPDLQTLSLDAEVSDVVAAIKKIIRRRHWTVVGEVRPVNFATGHIDVVAKSTVMGFPADITFRIREIGNKTQVDIRSVSRAGWQELPNSNGKRVDELVDQILEAADQS